jgi:hypothetical protein
MSCNAFINCHFFDGLVFLIFLTILIGRHMHFMYVALLWGPPLQGSSNAYNILLLLLLLHNTIYNIFIIYYYYFYYRTRM